MLDELTNQDLLILGCLLVLIALVGIICLIMTLASTSKKKKKVKLEDKKEVDINVSLATNDIPEISKEAPKLEELLNKKEEQKEEIQEEIKIEEPEVQEKQIEMPKQEEPQKSSIEDVLRLMNADLEKQKYENIDRYEEEQEENAVISYQELLDRKMALNDEKKEEQKEAFIPKFSNSEFISPIFGRVDKKEEQQVEMLDEEFLNNLKEFRSNL